MSREFWAIIGTGISLGILVVALAAFMVQSVNAINSRLDSMDARFVAIDNRFDSIDRRFDSIDRRFDSIDARFVAIDNRFDAIDARLLRIESVLEGVIFRLGRVEGRLQIPNDPDLEETQASPRANPDAGA